MTSPGKADTSYGEKNKKLSLKSRVDYKDPQSFICLIGKGDFNCIQLPASLQQVVLCIIFRMANLKLIAYASKRMPEAARNILLQKLEMCGLAINIASFAHLLKRVDFDAVVDLLSITHIMKSKAESATTQI